MRTRRTRLLPLLLIGALALLSPRWASASTAPCTQIDNTASVSYKVNNIDQGSKSSNTASFNVGIKVIVSVATDDVDEVSVAPGTTKQALKFTVTNSGNAIQDYTLAYEAASSGTASSFDGANDSFDGNTIAIHVDTNGNGSFDDGTDAASTTLNDVAADGGTAVAFIVYTPSDLAEDNLETAVYNLMATTTWVNGDAITFGAGQTPTAAQAGGSCDGAISVDVVAGDGTGGPHSGDGDNDGADSDDSAFEVSSATISVTKSSSVYSDPINGTTSPVAIPGAVVEYSIAIANTGGASATLTTITDTLDIANLTIVSADAGWSVAGSTRGTISGALTADGDNTDGLQFSSPTLTATLSTILAAEAGPPAYSAGELKAGETLTLTFRATIN